MAKGKSLRGSALDESLDRVLAEMLSCGFENDPISRTEVQRRLGLKSRATLVGERGERIDAARASQLREKGVDPDSKRRRRSLEERITRLQLENALLVSQHGRLYEALSMIALACQANGLDVEAIMAPLRASMLTTNTNNMHPLSLSRPIPQS